MSTVASVRAMVDFHSHCLPAMDDGAVDVAEATAMLSASVAQGVHTVVATPHFYRSEEDIVAFLQRRQQSVDSLEGHIPDGLSIVLGAEVLLQRGLSGLDLRDLCIQGTNRILMELPFMPPENWVYEELENIALAQRLDIIFAHVDRYMHWYTRAEMTSLLELPEVSVQLNAEAFLDAATFRSLRRWLPQPKRLVFGSDMHHIDRREPNLAKAYKHLSRKALGRRWITDAERVGPAMLLPPQPILSLEGFF